MPDLSWMDRAACTGLDTELWFTDSPRAVAAARTICDRCPVRRECLQSALDTPDTFGVWGGKTKYQRTRMAKVPRQRSVTAPGGVAKANAAKTHCKWGHEFTVENTAVYSGKRSCRTCQRRRVRTRRSA